MAEEKAKVLVVDDDSRHRKMLSLMLSGYLVQSAASGLEALDIVGAFTPDLILLDVSMPGLSGYEVCKKIRNNPRLRFTKIVFLSANREVEDRLSGYQAGGDDYITKPFNSSELLAKLEVLMRLKTAEEVDLIKRDALALLAHETGTPLSIIVRLCEQLIDLDVPEKESVHSAAKTILKSARRLSDHAEKAILAGQIKTSKKYRFSSASIEDMLKEVCSDVSEFALERKVSLKREVASSSVRANKRLLERALYYLLENAIKFSPERETVRISGSAADGMYFLSIEDKGIGIEAERIKEIFELFAIHDVSHHKAGLGVSLALAREIINLHQGSLEVQSSPGKGSTFTVSLPVCKANK